MHWWSDDTNFSRVDAGGEIPGQGRLCMEYMSAAGIYVPGGELKK